MISVIVPVYNTEKYLEECIDSILKQTYKNTEIILVDDGSTDNSSIICDSYAKQHRCIKVVHKKNGGLISARKAGLLESKGEYICFVDSDDYIDSFYLEKCYDLFNEFNADIVCMGLTLFDGKGIIEKRQEKHFSGFYSKNELITSVYPNLLSMPPFFHFGIMPSLCTKCFKKKVITDLYNSIPSHITLGEDAAISYPSLLRANSIYVSNDCGYMYRQHTSSMTHSYDPNLYSKVEKLLEWLLSCCDVTKNDIKNQLNSYFIYLLILLKNNELFYNTTDAYGTKKKKFELILNNKIFQKAFSDTKNKFAFSDKILLFCLKHRLIFLIYITGYFKSKKCGNS